MTKTQLICYGMAPEIRFGTIRVQNIVARRIVFSTVLVSTGNFEKPNYSRLVDFCTHYSYECITGETLVPFLWGWGESERGNKFEIRAKFLVA